MYLSRSWYFSLLVISIPFTGVLKLNHKVSLPIFLFSILPIFFYDKLRITKRTILFFYIFILIVTSYTFLNISVSGITYSLSFILCSSVFTIGGFLILQILGLKKFITILSYTYFFTSFFILYEFLTINFLPNLFIDIPGRFDGIEKYRPGIMNELFVRSRGLAEESGHMGLFIEFSLPLLVFNRNYISNNFFYFLIILSILVSFCIFSPFTFLCIIILAFFVSIKNTFKYLFPISILLSFVPNIQFYLQEAWKTIAYKITFSTASKSSSDRLERLNCFFKNIDEIIFGIGPFNIKSICGVGKDTFLNLYMDIVSSFGPLILIVFIFLIVIFPLSLNYKPKGFIISLIFISAHYLLISNFWYPYIWILIGFLIYCKNEENSTRYQ